MNIKILKNISKALVGFLVCIIIWIIMLLITSQPTKISAITIPAIIPTANATEKEIQQSILIHKQAAQIQLKDNTIKELHITLDDLHEKISYEELSVEK